MRSREGEERVGECKCARTREGVFQAGGRTACGSVVSEGVCYLLVIRIPGVPVDEGDAPGASEAAGVSRRQITRVFVHVREFGLYLRAPKSH